MILDIYRSEDDLITICVQLQVVSVAFSKMSYFDVFCLMRRSARSHFDTRDARDASIQLMKYMKHHMSSQVLLLLPVVGGQLGKGQIKEN